MLMIRKDFDIFGDALIIQKKLLQTPKPLPTPNTFGVDLRKIFDKNEKILNARKRLSKSITNISPTYSNKKSSHNELDDEIETNRNTTTILLNKKIKLSKRNVKSLFTNQKSSTKPFNKNNSNAGYNNDKIISSNKTKKVKLTRSSSSHETSKTNFNNSSNTTFKTTNSLNTNSNTRRSSTSIPFRSNRNSINNIKQSIINKSNEIKPNIINDNQEPQQLDKRQRFDIYMKLLDSKPNAKSIQEAILLINTTLDEVEEKHAPKKDDKVFGINSKKYGRMNPVPHERIQINPETGKMEMLTTGLTIVLEEDGSFDIWTIKRGNFDVKRVYHKNGVKIASS
jgi:hypothetical protein